MSSQPSVMTRRIDSKSLTYGEITIILIKIKDTMVNKAVQPPVMEQEILNRIYLIRNQKVMLDHDLAGMYKVETKRLNEQVKRNINRFPDDFMFILTQEEFDYLKSQFATSSDATGWGGRRDLPRVFTRLREYALTHNEILLKLARFEKEMKGNSQDIENIFAILKELIGKQGTSSPRNRIGFEQRNKFD